MDLPKCTRRSYVSSASSSPDSIRSDLDHLVCKYSQKKKKKDCTNSNNFTVNFQRSSSFCWGEGVWSLSFLLIELSHCFSVVLLCTLVRLRQSNIEPNLCFSMILTCLDCVFARLSFSWFGWTWLGWAGLGYQFHMWSWIMHSFLTTHASCAVGCKPAVGLFSQQLALPCSGQPGTREGFQWRIPWCQGWLLWLTTSWSTRPTGWDHWSAHQAQESVQRHKVSAFGTTGIFMRHLARRRSKFLNCRLA